MQIFKWMHAVTAAALLGTFVGCDDQDFNPEAETMEAQPAGTYDADPGVLDGTETDQSIETNELEQEAGTEEFQQSPQEDLRGTEGEADTNDTLEMLNSPSTLDTELPQEQTTDEASLETADEPTTAGNEDAASEAEPVAENAEPVAEDVVEEE